MLEEHRLDSKVHDCAAFDCGTPVLNESLARFATQHRRRRIAQISVLVDSSLPSAVLGYDTLSAAEVHTAQITDADRKRLPRFPVQSSPISAVISLRLDVLNSRTPPAPKEGPRGVGSRAIREIHPY